MTFKTPLLSAAAVLALTSAFAFVSPANAAQDTRPEYVKGTPSPLSGVYVGGYGGYGWTDADINGGGDADLDGVDYGGFVGYTLDTLLDRTIGMGINGSLEAFYGGSSQDDGDFDKGQEWGVNFRPGLSFVDDYTMGLKPYGIIGYRNGEFDSASGGKDWHDGFELGLGTEVIAEGNFGIRLDYSHVWWSDEGGVDPDEDDLRLGVAYHF